jgi:hypothetical protein
MKKKKNKKIAIAVLIIAGVFFVIMIVFLILSGITKKNPEGILGNTAGNLYNLGLYCECDGTIYFANPSDDGVLYKMTSDCRNVKKVYSDKIRYINADKNYIYYARNNQLKAGGGSIFSVYNTGLYRINARGNAKLKTICTDPVASVLLYGNDLYYQKYHSTTGLYLYNATIDGNSDKLLVQEGLIPACIYNGSMFVSGINEDRNIWALDLKTGDRRLIYQGMTYFPIATDDWVYFIDLGDYHVYRTAYGGEKKEIVNKMVCTYNISLDGRYLYYQTDRYDSNHIGVIDLTTGKDTVILEGTFKYINVTSNYVFFTMFDETTYYAYTTDGTGTLNLFEPGKAK